MSSASPAKKRCSWVGHSALMQQYHDDEWGKPEWDGRALWAKLVLDGFQAGLSWSTILNKRENFRRTFHGFDPQRIARYGQKDINRLLGNAGIIRHKGKIEATISNARAYLTMQDAGDDFAQFCWQFVEYEPQHNARKYNGDVPAQTQMSQDFSRALKARGFRFCGPTIVYAFAQAVGMVNDHWTDCFRYKELLALAPSKDYAVFKDTGKQNKPD